MKTLIIFILSIFIVACSNQTTTDHKTESLERVQQYDMFRAGDIFN